MLQRAWVRPMGPLETSLLVALLCQLLAVHSRLEGPSSNVEVLVPLEVSAFWLAGPDLAAVAEAEATGSAVVARASPQVALLGASCARDPQRVLALGAPASRSHQEPVPSLVRQLRLGAGLQMLLQLLAQLAKQPQPGEAPQQMQPPAQLARQPPLGAAWHQWRFQLSTPMAKQFSQISAS